jgi:hypothetical protein
MNMANSNKLSEIVKWTETGHWFQKVAKSCKKLKPFQLCEFLHNFHSPVLEIQIGNIPVLAIIDSGCSSFLMSQGYYNTLFKNQPLDTYKGLPFQQASGAALPIKGTFLTNIQIGPLKTHTQIIVFESNDYHKEVLLGWDYIKAQNILIASDGLYYREALHQKTGNDNSLPINHACGAGRDTSPPHGSTQRSPPGSNSPEETSLNISEPCYDQTKFPVIIVKDYTILEGQCEIIQCKLKPSLENRKIFDNLFSNTKYFVFSSENIEPYEYILKLSIYFQMLTLDHFEQPFDLIYRNYSKQTVFLSNKDIVAYCTEMELASQSDIETLSLKKPALFLAAKLLQPADSQQDIAPSLKSPNFSRLELGQKSISPIDLDQINKQDISPEHFQILRNIIHQHAPLFASHSWSVGLCGSTFEMSVRDSCVPQQARLIPVPNKMKDQAIEILKKLIDLGLVTESKSPWKSNILFLMKKGYKLKKEKNGVLEKIPISKIRIVLDFRAVNKALRVNWCAYPIPKIQDILATIQGKKYVTRLDISQGFWSVKLGPKASNLCSFEFLGGLYKLTRLGQGLIPSSFVFQRAVHRLILKNKLGENVSNYLDDIVVTSQTIEEHFDILKKLFLILQENNVKLKLVKCDWLITKKLNLLGFEVDVQKGTISPEKSLVNKFLDIPNPKNQKTLQKILGSIAFFSPLLKNLSLRLSPLYDLLKKNAKFHLGEPELKALNFIRKEMALFPTIFLLNLKKPIHAFADGAMSQSIAYVLMQWSDKYQNLIPCKFQSHRLNVHQKNYSQAQVEALSLATLATENYDILQYSTNFIYNDCKSLSFINCFKNHNLTVFRYHLLISSLNLIFIWLPSSNPLINLVDLLTRPNPRSFLQTKTKINSKVTLEKVADLKFINMENFPPCTYEQIDQILSSFHKLLKSSSPPELEKLKNKQLKETHFSPMPQILSNFSNKICKIYSTGIHNAIDNTPFILHCSRTIHFKNTIFDLEERLATYFPKFSIENLTSFQAKDKYICSMVKKNHPNKNIKIQGIV